MSVIDDSTYELPSPAPVAVHKWAAIAGRWTFDGGTARFHGPEDPLARPPLGLALGSVRFRDGQITTNIRLSRNESTSAGIVFGYQSLNSPYLVAQIGAFNKAYAISEYRPGHGWFSHVDAGSLSNLNVDQHYSLTLQVSAQSVRMTVDVSTSWMSFFTAPSKAPALDYTLGMTLKSLSALLQSLALHRAFS